MSIHYLAISRANTWGIETISIGFISVLPCMSVAANSLYCLWATNVQVLTWDLVMNAEISKRDHKVESFVLPMQLLQLTWHTQATVKVSVGMSERATQMLLKYARNIAVHLQHNWQQLLTDFFFQTNKVFLFWRGCHHSQIPTCMIYHISDVKCWTHKVHSCTIWPTFRI